MKNTKTTKTIFSQVAGITRTTPYTVEQRTALWKGLVLAGLVILLTMIGILVIQLQVM